MWLLSKGKQRKNRKQKTTSVGKDVQKLEPCALLVGVKVLLLLWGSSAAPPRVKHRNAICPSDSASGVHPKELEGGAKNRRRHTPVIHSSRRQRRPEGPSVDEWDSTWSVQPYEGRRC